jgi:hypothetical protein
MTRDAWNDLVARARAIGLDEVARRHGLKLRRQGPELIGACPVCQAGEDRFSIHPAKGLFNCRI